MYCTFALFCSAASLGAYNLYAKRASFKDDVLFQQIVTDKPEEAATSPTVIEKHVPIAPDETEEELPEEEQRKRDAFKARRRLLALEGADGLDLKAVLAHRVSLVDNVEEEDEPNWEDKPRTENTVNPMGASFASQSTSFDSCTAYASHEDGANDAVPWKSSGSAIPSNLVWFPHFGFTFTRSPKIVISHSFSFTLDSLFPYCIALTI
ncbi:hypothetical protein X801_03299 [Opisthorchis viverrini]|uniref:Uncharacterized protein n=1 Tax=Opisthorchis viverrini TaxID=6198 RepID=A0A1S8X270_OPIVI|nr:hypothetical protein X801_03299 [Opisthorchis viverrini]